MGDFGALVEKAAARYRTVGKAAPHYARSKMLMDPVYRTALDVAAPIGGTVLDIGCGRGFSLALFHEASSFGRLIGIETRAATAAIAQRALRGDAEIVLADAREASLADCSVVLVFDVLQLMPFADQERLLDGARAAMSKDGVLLMREADSSAGLHFHAVRVINSLKAQLMRTNHRPYYRNRDEWLSTLKRVGLTAEICAIESRNPLGNVLYRARRT